MTEDKFRMYVQLRRTEERHATEDAQPPFVKIEERSAIAPLLDRFSDIRPETYVSLLPTGTAVVSNVSIPTSTATFATALAPIDTLRTKTFADLNASTKSIEDTTVRDLKLMGPDAREPTTVAAAAASTSTRRVSNAWFQESGGTTYFSNFIAAHQKIAHDSTMTDAAGSRLVSCVTPKHISFYLFEAIGHERPCCNGEECIARRCVPHPLADETAEEACKRKAMDIVATKGESPKFQWNPNAAHGGIILKEFLDAAERDRFCNTGMLPARNGPCIICMRATVTHDFFLAGFYVKQASAPHYHPINVRGGYKQTACLQFAGPSAKHMILPMRYFDATEYLPMTLGEAITTEMVALLPVEREMLQHRSGELPRVRGYVEDGSVHYFRATRWLSTQASSLGMEPLASYVPALSRLPGSDDERVFTPLALIEQIAARAARPEYVVKLLLGCSFVDACRSVRNGMVPADMLGQLRQWQRFGRPRRIVEDYSILATLLARVELLADTRRSIAYQIDLIIQQKCKRDITMTTAQAILEKRRTALSSLPATDSSKSALDAINDMLIGIALIDKAHKPLLRWMYAAIHAGHSVADRALTGGLCVCDETTLRCIVGELNPDHYLPPDDIPNDSDELPVVHLRFPSHREAILRCMPPDLRHRLLRDYLQDTAIPDGITVEDALDEFWRAAIKLGANTIATRIAVSDKLAREDMPHMWYRIQEFQWTHLDMAAAGSTLPYDYVYPFDGRNGIDCDAPPLTALLTQCGFFEQVVDPATAMSILHAFDKAVPRACNSREARSVTAQACLENSAFATLVVKLVYQSLLGAYPHAHVHVPFATALKVRQIVCSLQTDIRARAIRHATAQAYEGCKNAETVVIPACAARFRGNAVQVALAMADVFRDVPNGLAGALGEYLLKPFRKVAAAIVSTVRRALIFEMKREMKATATTASISTAVDEWLATRRTTTPVLSTVIARLSLGGIYGGDSLEDMQAPMDIVLNEVGQLVPLNAAMRAEFVANLRKDAHGRTSMGSAYLVDPIAIRQSFKRAVLNTFGARCAPETIDQMLSAIGPYVFHGLAYIVCHVISTCAADLLDVTGACSDAVRHVRNMTDKLSVARSVANLEGGGGGGGLNNAIREWLSCTSPSPPPDIVVKEIVRIAETARKRRRYCGIIIPCTSSQPSSRKKDVDAVIAALERIALNTVSDAAGLAQMGLQFGNALTMCMQASSSALEHYKAAAVCSGAPFVEANSTLVHYAVREALVAGLSRNPILVRAFCERGEWFPEFLDHCVDVMDMVRGKVCASGGTLPLDADVKEYANTIRREKWGGQVFRLHRLDESFRFSKILSQVRLALQRAGVIINDDRPKRRQLALEYILAEHAAHGFEIVDTHARDLEVLWHLGLREHGLSIVSRMHRLHMDFPGNKDLKSVVEEFTRSEFVLVSEFYMMQYVIKSLKKVPIGSRRWSEATLAALCIRHGIDNSAPVLTTLQSLYVCDSCASIVTQLTLRCALKQVDLASCYGASYDANGRLICANRRNLGKKDKAEEREMVNAIVRKNNSGGDKQQQQQQQPAAAAASSKSVRRRRHKHDECDDVLLQRLPPVLPACKDSRIRSISGIGRVIEFGRKYRSPREKVPDSKLPLVITPCCGKWMRYSRDDWNGDRLMCAACVYTIARKKVPPPNMCIVCGSVLKRTTPPAATSKRSTQAEPAIYAEMLRKNDPFYKMSQQMADMMQIRMNKCMGPSFLIGRDMPVPWDCAAVTYVIDDDVTFGVIPVGVCMHCRGRADMSQDPVSEWPLLLSKFRAWSTARLADFNMKSSLRKASLWGAK